MSQSPADPLAQLWAKSRDNGDAWMPLRCHLADAAGTAAELWDSWLPGQAKAIIEDSVKDPQLAKKLAVFLAAVHDVGKASAFFQEKVPQLAHRVSMSGMYIPELGPEKYLAPHATLGAFVLRDWLMERWGFSTFGAEELAVIVGGHHGVYPGLERGEDIENALAREDSPWFEARNRALEEASICAGLNEDDWKTLAAGRLSQAAQLVLTGVVIVADWIASNEDYFLYPEDEEQPDTQATVLADPSPRHRVSTALNALSLPGPWRTQPAPDLAGASEDEAIAQFFRERFSFPREATPRPMQADAVRAAEELEGPGLIIIEAPTGEGKTEAALAAAETLARRFNSGGVMVALPTCATSDGIFSRVLRWLESAVPAGQRASMALTHSRAGLNDDYQSLFARPGRPDPFSGVRGVWGDQDNHHTQKAAIEAHHWLRGRKTAALAAFTVGTIDQFLMCALKSKHVMLRHLGLASKVVVLDEIHAADYYMQVYLHRALEWCGAHGVPVIACSATLPPVQRAALLESYRRGRCVAQGMTKLKIKKLPSLQENSLAFPLICTVSDAEMRRYTPAASGRFSRTTLEIIGDDVDALAERILSEIHDGGCVAIIRNTVKRACELYERLVADPRLGEDNVRLLHSRFIASDRRELERQLLDKLGPKGDRPERLVVVATQVIEQSLDIDVDLMVSDLAPIDLLVQRIGRLHRHNRDNRPTGLQEARLLITGMSDAGNWSTPPEIDRGSCAIYGESTLLRTLATLYALIFSRSKPVLHSPEDVPALVAMAYAESLEDVPPPASAWSDPMAAADENMQIEKSAKEQKARAFLAPKPTKMAVWGWNEIGTAEEVRGQAQVRDIQDSIEVIVIREDQQGPTCLEWIDQYGGHPVDSMGGIPRDLALALARCTVTLPSAPFRNADRLDRLIQELEGRTPESWSMNPWLRGMLALPINDQGVFEWDGLIFRYDRKLGLEVGKREC